MGDASCNRQLIPQRHLRVHSFQPSANRGVRRRGYYVLRKTAIPAVLVECGFLTNPTEAAYAQTASYRQKLAEEIAAGVRGRSSLGSASYIDQTKVTRSERHSSKRSHKKSARKKKSSSKPAGSEARSGSINREA
ncbi:MAG: hypothetical protein DMF10_00590 [Verrucomicrobia bacterium]|nr:MAG: hypothetical protein DMF10_00590 [Verrucomicrobiota bacterium]